MGFAASWICARGISKAEALEALELVETGDPAELFRTPFSLGHLDGGWLAISTTDPDWLLPQKVKALSAGGLSVGCFMSDYVMLSGACAYDRGTQLWWVTHEPEEGLTNLSFGGRLPEAFEKLRADAADAQAKEREGPMQVDFFFDVPMQLTEAVCGIRADESEAAFTALRPLKPQRKGLLARLLGR